MSVVSCRVPTFWLHNLWLTLRSNTMVIQHLLTFNGHYPACDCCQQESGVDDPAWPQNMMNNTLSPSRVNRTFRWAKSYQLRSADQKSYIARLEGGEWTPFRFGCKVRSKHGVRDIGLVRVFSLWPVWRSEVITCGHKLPSLELERVGLLLHI